MIPKLYLIQEKLIIHKFYQIPFKFINNMDDEKYSLQYNYKTLRAAKLALKVLKRRKLTEMIKSKKTVEKNQSIQNGNLYRH